MRRSFSASAALAAGLWLLSAGHLSPSSVEQMFVAETQAAADAENICLMPDAEEGQQQGIPIPTSSDILGGDIPPVRMVVDPYPSYNGVAVDTTNDLVMMSDTNRKSLLVYPRTVGEPASAKAQARQARVSASNVATPLQTVMGPATGVGYIAGVAMDPEHRELFAVNNDVEDRMVVFDYDARGNMAPKRLLYVPHQSWGIALAKKRNELALSVQTPNMYIVFRRDAKKFDRPLRSVKGPHTGMADPHGIYFDETHNEIVVANHGNFRPAELITSYTAYDARESRQEKAATTALDENARGRFIGSSLTIYDGDAKGDAAPLRTIEGPLTGLDWPMGVAVDEANNEIIVANNGDNSILVFKRTAKGNVQPDRVIRGPATGIKGPMGVALAKDEIWVANFGDHTALVFPRTAAGNAVPKRIVRNAPPGKETSGFGNPYSVAYDTKRKEILVPN